MKMKMKLWDASGRERFLAAGEVAPAGWFKDGNPPSVLAREMRVEELVVEGNPYDQIRQDRKVLVLRPNISAAQAAAESAAKAAAVAAEVSAEVGGLAWRIDASDRSPADVLRALKGAGSFGRAVKAQIALADGPGAVVVFENADPYYARVHVEMPDGRHSIMNRVGWATQVGRSAHAAASAVASGIDPDIQVSLVVGDGLEIRHGSVGAAVKDGEDIGAVCRRVLAESRGISAAIAVMPDKDDIGGGGWSKVD